MTTNSLQAIQEFDIYVLDADGVLEDANDLKRAIKKYNHEIPFAARLADAANVLRTLENQEANVRAQLRLCSRQLHDAVGLSDRHREQLLAKVRMLYIELDRLHGLQEKAKTHVEGVRLERQSRVPSNVHFLSKVFAQLGL